MARPQKVGLEYFPLDVDCDSDDKVMLIESDLGLVGYAALIKLLQKIYKEGYFYEFSEKELLLFAKKRLDGDVSLARNLVASAVRWGFFDEKLYLSRKILTSKAIQTRYLKAVKGRSGVNFDPEILLIEVPKNCLVENDSFLPGKPELTEEKTPVNSQKSTQIKLNQIKLKERREDPSLSDQERPKILEEKIPFQEVRFQNVSEEVFSSSAKPEPKSTAASPESTPPDPFLVAALKFFEEPDGKPWASNNAFVSAGRRPLKKYPNLWISPPELAQVFELWHGKIPPEKFKNGFQMANTRATSQIAAGKLPEKIDVGSWLIGWIYQTLLESETKEERLNKARTK